jgi:hypothetical protein
VNAGRAIIWLLLVASAACSPTIPRPPSGPTPREAGVEVPYPPPPARIEVVKFSEVPGEVWVDGQWDWDGQTFQWFAGHWRAPPKGAYFTPWSAARRADGTLVFHKAAWRALDGRRIADTHHQPIACPTAGDPARDDAP